MATAIADPPKLAGGDRSLMTSWGFLTLAFMAVGFKGAGVIGGALAFVIGYVGIKAIQWMTKNDSYWRLTYLASTSYACDYSDRMANTKASEWARPYGFCRGLRQ